MSNELAQSDPQGKYLSQYAADGVDRSAPKFVWLATVSAGDKDDRGNPRSSRDGRIILHQDQGEAPGIAGALAETGFKSLTISLMHDRIDDNFKQMFVAYGKDTIFGDDESLTTIRIGEDGLPQRRTLKAGTEGYEKLKAQCKVSTFIPFALATWTDEGEPFIYFPDGVGFYRLRTTSRNTVNNLRAAAQIVSGLTGGKLAGVPFEMTLQYPVVTGPDRKRRPVPVFKFVFKPPQVLQMRAKQLAGALLKGIRDAENLSLTTAIDPELFAHSEEMIEAEIMSEENAPAMERLATGEPTPQEVYATRRRTYFAITEGTPYAFKEGRPGLISDINAHFVLDVDGLGDLVTVVDENTWQEICAYIAKRIESEAQPVAEADKSAKSAKAQERIEARREPRPAMPGTDENNPFVEEANNA